VSKNVETRFSVKN